MIYGDLSTLEMTGGKAGELLGKGGGTSFWPRRHRGTRRTAYFFCPRRARRNTGELLFVRGGRGEARRTAYFFCPRRARRGAENGELLLSAEDAEGRGELRTAFLSAVFRAR